MDRCFRNKIMKYLRLKVFVYSNSPLSAGECSRTPRGYMKACRVPNPIYILYFFLHITIIKLNLEIGHNKRVTAVTNNKIEEL